MIRKLMIPLLAAGLLAGCVTDYTARGGGGPGTYYYGRPSVDYNYYGGYGGGYYGPGYGYYPYGESYRFRNGGYYGNPYYGYYGNPYYYGYPRYYYPNRPHRPNRPNPPTSGNPPSRGDGGLPWRDTRPVGGGAWGPRNDNPGATPQVRPQMARPQMAPRAPAAPSVRRDGGRAWRDVER